MGAVGAGLARCWGVAGSAVGAEGAEGAEGCHSRSAGPARHPRAANLTTLWQGIKAYTTWCSTADDRARPVLDVPLLDFTRGRGWKGATAGCVSCYQMNPT